MSKVKSCPTCKKDFGLFRWRYNCDHCKEVFCDDCLTKHPGSEYCLDNCNGGQLCKSCFSKYSEKLELDKANYLNNKKNWIRGTKQEYIKGYRIIKEIGLIETKDTHDSPAEVEKESTHVAILNGAHGYIKYFWDKHIKHHEEEYIAGHGKQGNPYYRTRHWTTQHFTGHATAVIVEKKITKKQNINEDSYKYVLECSQSLEKYIEKNLKGQGKGLHEKITSIEEELSEKDIKNFRFIATVRNQIVHEGQIKNSPYKFKEICQQLKLKYNLR